MRILMVNKYAYVTGGADRQCIALANLLRDVGHDVAFISVDDERNLERCGLFVPSLVTNKTRDFLNGRQKAKVLGNAIWNTDAARAMKRLSKSFRPDIVHAHKLYPQLSASVIAMARRASLPIVQTLHDYEFISASSLDADGGRIDRLESRLIYRALNTAVFPVRTWQHSPAVSEWIAVSEYVARVHAARGIHATVVHNFADVDIGCPSRERSEREGLVFVGTLSVEKGILDVLEVARRVTTERFIIAGSGPLEATVLRMAANLSNVEFRGRLDPDGVSAAMGSARVVLIPSRWPEPGALVALEAMAAGTPIAAYRSGGLPEYVERTGAGLVVPPDPDSLAAACQRLLGSAAIWERCSASGLSAVANEFSKDAHVRAVLGVYERALDAPRRRWSRSLD